MVPVITSLPSESKSPICTNKSDPEPHSGSEDSELYFPEGSGDVGLSGILPLGEFLRNSPEGC